MRTRGKLDNAKDAMEKVRENCKKRIKKRKKLKKLHSAEMALVQPLSQYTRCHKQKYII